MFACQILESELRGRIEALEARPLAELLLQQGILRTLAQEILLRELKQSVTFTATEAPLILNRLWEGVDGPPPTSLAGDWIANLPEPLRLGMAQRWDQVRMQKLIETRYADRLEPYFLERRKDLEQVVYGLIRLRNQGAAEELYLRLLDDGADFTELAKHHSVGEERFTHGLVGPMLITQPHPTIRAVLESLKVGDVHAPFRVEQWVLLVRMEHRQPARLNDATRIQLLQELLQQELDETLDAMLAGFYPTLVPMEAAAEVHGLAESGSEADVTPEVVSAFPEEQPAGIHQSADPPGAIAEAAVDDRSPVNAATQAVAFPHNPESSAVAVSQSPVADPWGESHPTDPLEPDQPGQPLSEEAGVIADAAESVEAPVFVKDLTLSAEIARMQEPIDAENRDDPEAALTLQATASASQKDVALERKTVVVANLAISPAQTSDEGPLPGEATVEAEDSLAEEMLSLSAEPELASQIEAGNEPAELDKTLVFDDSCIVKNVTKEGGLKAEESYSTIDGITPTLPEPVDTGQAESRPRADSNLPPQPDFPTPAIESLAAGSPSTDSAARSAG